MVTVAAFLLLTQAQVTSITGTYRLYASAMNGVVATPVPAGTLVLRANSTYTAAGRAGKYARSGSSLRFVTGPYAGGSATFSRRAGKVRVNVTTSHPEHPKRKLKLFGNRS